MSANNAKKGSALPEYYDLRSTDLLFGLRDPSGTANNFKVTGTNAFGNLAINVVTTKQVSANNFKISAAPTTPASSIDVVPRGTIWFDADFIYIAVADNTIKRATLSTF
jgi:hypothetical protein